MTEKELQNAILRKWATKPELRLFRQNVGVAVPLTYIIKLMALMAKGQFKAAVNYASIMPRNSYGTPGMADLSGIIKGRRLEVEVKGPKGKQQEDQIRWQEMIERFGGIYILAYSVEDVDIVLEAILNEGD